MAHNSLANYYMLMHNLSQNSKYTVDFIESIVPYERDIYVGLVQTDIEKRNKVNESIVFGNEANFS